MTYKQIITDLENKVYHPVYFLCGEEPYYIDKISDHIEAHILNETEKEFNQTVLYGIETDVPSIISYAKRYPMMANYQVVIVKEAQKIDKIEELEPYIKNPLKSTVLVICYKFKKIDRRKTFAKQLESKAVLFESKKIYDNKIPQWIAEYVKEIGYVISPNSALILGEYLGNDLSKIVNEIKKIIISIPKKTEISLHHIYDNIGISKDFNIFELQSAIAHKNIYKANQIINYFAANPKENPFIKNITILFSFFCKILHLHSLNETQRNNIASELSILPMFINEYSTAKRHYSAAKLIKIMGYLREYDLKAKGVDSTGNIKEGELYRELLFKILH